MGCPSHLRRIELFFAKAGRWTPAGVKGGVTATMLWFTVSIWVGDPARQP